MLKIIDIILIVLAIPLSYFLYIGFLRPLDPIPAVAEDLVQHFAHKDILTTPSTIRHGFKDLEAAVVHTISDHP